MLGRAVNRRAVEGLGGIAIDGHVICAIGTLSLRTLAANIGIGRSSRGPSSAAAS
jgi:hypothetical protein